ncbi:MAG: T9SS type A sorting domain-containing protein [Sphingobacteriaceae bacterium]|nr:T9SS type A sorting domain-containing protein [Sphingobacteriaceae bacterium]
MKKLLLFVLLSSFFKFNAQVYTYTATPTYTSDVPGSTLYYHIGFYNPTSSSITIQFERYTKYEPPYWYSCFCFIQCHPPSLDYVDIEVPPFSWGPQMSILFKNDSVNPGQATASIKINQVGFANNADTIHLTAATILSTGIKATTVTNNLSFPNPTLGEFTFVASENKPYHLIINDINGKCIYQQKDIVYRKHQIQLEDKPQGTYFLQAIYNSGKIETKKIIKN